MMDSEQLLSQEFIKAHPADAARMLEQIQAREVTGFLADIPPELAAMVTKRMLPSAATQWLELMEATTAASIIARLPIEITAILLRRVGPPKRLGLMQTLPAEISESLELVLQYPQNTAGALMDPRALTLTDDMTVSAALKLIQTQARHTYHDIPVLNREHILRGLTSIRKLMLSEPEASVYSVMQTGIGQFSPNSNREAILAHPDWRTYHDLPVVDETGRFLGVIDYQTIRRLESDIKESIRPRSAYDTGKALGELYWIGMSAFIRGATTVVSPDKGPKE